MQEELSNVRMNLPKGSHITWWTEPRVDGGKRAVPPVGSRTVVVIIVRDAAFTGMSRWKGDTPYNFDEGVKIALKRAFRRYQDTRMDARYLGVQLWDIQNKTDRYMSSNFG